MVTLKDAEGYLRRTINLTYKIALEESLNKLAKTITVEKRIKRINSFIYGLYAATFIVATPGIAIYEIGSRLMQDNYRDKTITIEQKLQKNIFEKLKKEIFK